MKRVIRTLLIAAILTFIIVQLSGCRPKNALLYDDSINHFAATALDRLAYSYMTVTSLEDFVTAMTTQAWDLIVSDNPFWNDLAYGTDALLNDYVSKGGRAVISSWQMFAHPGWDLWEELGCSYGGTPNYTVESIFKLQPTHTLWRKPNVLPDLYLEFADNNIYSTHGFPSSILGDGEILAVFDTDFPATTGALFIANDGRTIYNAFLLDDGIEGGLPLDRDSDGVGDSIEYWMNEISFVASKSGKSIMPVMPAGAIGFSEGANTNN